MKYPDNPNFSKLAQALREADQALGCAFVTSRDALHLPLTRLEPLSVVLKEAIANVERHLLLKAYRTMSRIQVRDVKLPTRLSPEKIAAAKASGAKGGRSTSAAKQRAARENARLPRPNRRGKPVGVVWSNITPPKTGG